MAEYDDPLSALPTVAPPRVKKPEDELAPAGGSTAPVGADPVGGTVTDTATEEGPDYFGNFPQDDAGSPGAMPFYNPITEYAGDGGLVPGPEAGGIPWDGEMVNATAPIPDGPLGDFGRERIDRMRERFPDMDIPDPTTAPVPGGDQGIPEDDLIPDEMQPPADISDQDLLEQYRRYASEGLANPSRYDMELVQQALDQMDSHLQDQREQGVAGLDEMMSQRGLVGSSVEGNQRSELIQDLERQRGDYALGLATDMAKTHAQDRTAAANIASEPMRIRIAQRSNELREKGMDLDEAFRQAQFEVQQEMFFGNQGNRDEFGGTFAEDQRRADIDAYYQHLALLSQMGLDEDDWERMMRNNPPPANSQGDQQFEQPPSFTEWMGSGEKTGDTWDLWREYKDEFGY